MCVPICILHYMGTLEWRADRMSSDTDHHRTGVVRTYIVLTYMCVCVLRQQYTLGQMKCRTEYYIIILLLIQ